MAKLDGELIAGLSSQQQELAGQGIPSTWNTYVNVDNVVETTAKAVAAGAQVIAPPMAIGDSGRMSVVRDPSGAAIGMWQAGTHKGAGLVNEPGALIWNEVYAPDAMPFPGGGSYTFKLGDAPIGGTAPPSMGQSPQWQVWFGSADVDATVAKAGELGATVLVPPTDSPIGKFAFLRDPTGAAFSVISAGQPR